MNIKTVLSNYNWPLIISILGLLLSLLSAWYTQKNFTRNVRPFVWAVNYSYIVNNKMIHEPGVIYFHVTNSPARINNFELEIALDNNTLLSYNDTNTVQFPTDTIGNVWSFSFEKNEFDKKIMNLSDIDKSRLIRTVKIDYSALDGGKIYHYLLRQSFIPSDGNWRNLSAESE